MEAIDKRNIYDSINEFYKMKDKYETDYKEKYINPILKSKTAKEKNVLLFQNCLNQIVLIARDQ